ncbi:MAG: ATP-binding protein [Clostridiales bacterium 38-18]|nr:MAG: ATP-binding protein [Clostridiales bacterium 38-18]
MNQLKIAKVLNKGVLGPVPSMINRHGLIAGATGTGKTITMKLFIEELSKLGVPTFLVDVKGDLNGFECKGQTSEKLTERLAQIEEATSEFDTFPTHYWDLFGKNGLPIRTTISDMGPMLLARLLSLNETQTSILHTLFKFADDEGLLLIDFKDLKALVEFAYNNSTNFLESYGGLNKASLGAVIRQLNTFEQMGVDAFFGEPALEIEDFMKIKSGKGVINRLDATQLVSNPLLYSTFLLWLLSEIYETLPEAGDLDVPKVVFFFDEAHLIFNKIPGILLSQIEQVIRLIRSKGVGIYFVTQSPTDLPDSVLGQLGNRIQHALRAYTAKEIKQLKLAAQTFRVNPSLNIEEALLSLGVGEALISCLDEKGTPNITERAYILAPQSAFGHQEEINYFIDAQLNEKYSVVVDRESAYERLQDENPLLDRNTSNPSTQNRTQKSIAESNAPKKRGRKPDSIFEKVAKSFISSLGSSAGRSLARGLLGTLKKL